MYSKRIKILIIGHCDVPFKGHALDMANTLPNEFFNKRLVVMNNEYGNYDIPYFYNQNNIFGLCKSKFWKFIRKIKIILKYRQKLQLSSQNGLYNFNISDLNNISALDILKKCPDFTPDIIMLMWTRTFISAKTIKDLYNITNAKFAFILVDQAHLTGGCHYVIDCNQYLNGCHNCPALTKCKKIAETQMSDKLDAFKNIQKYIIGVPADIRLAKKSPLFINSKFYSYIDVPKINSTPKDAAKDYFSIKKTSFVVLLGANSINDKRKGFIYSFEAIKKVCKSIDNLCILIIGHLNDSSVLNFFVKSNIQVVTPGFLNTEGLIKAFCAADCFLSTTVADSGPMMINYSVAVGVPVISFNVGVAQDIVIHKKNGYIAKYKDDSDIANGIKFIYNLNDTQRLFIKQQSLKIIDDLKCHKTWFIKLYNDYYDIK